MNSEFSRLNHELHRFNLPTRPDNRTAAYLQASHRSATRRPTMTTGSNPLASHMMTKTHGAAAAACGCSRLRDAEVLFQAQPRRNVAMLHRCILRRRRSVCQCFLQYDLFFIYISLFFELRTHAHIHNST